MPPALETLKRRAQFVAVAKARRSAATPGLVLQVARAGEAERRSQGRSGGGLRVGYTASRKVGGAVLRNRAKRRLRAAAAQVLPTHGRAGFDYVLIARDGTHERSFGGLLRDLETALKKLNVWRPDEGAPHGVREDDGTA